MWTLDPANSADLIAALRPHRRGIGVHELSVGEGWRSLVAQCHEALVADFPEYELFGVKQKFGYLAFQAFPRKRSPDGTAWTMEEAARLHVITHEFSRRSEQVCEWCGGDGVLREGRNYIVTLCDACDITFDDPPQDLGSWSPGR